jgi:hypothetical protein
MIPVSSPSGRFLLDYSINLSVLGTETLQQWPLVHPGLDPLQGVQPGWADDQSRLGQRHPEQVGDQRPCPNRRRRRAGGRRARWRGGPRPAPGLAGGALGRIAEASTSSPRRSAAAAGTRHANRRPRTSAGRAEAAARRRALGVTDLVTPPASPAGAHTGSPVGMEVDGGTPGPNATGPPSPAPRRTAAGQDGGEPTAKHMPDHNGAALGKKQPP